jgi:hypothetical protein
MQIDEPLAVSFGSWIPRLDHAAEREREGGRHTTNPASSA